MSEKAREFWIFKGDSNFCQELVIDWETDQERKDRPCGFYDIVSTKDTVEGGIHVREVLDDETSAYHHEAMRTVAEAKAHLAEQKLAAANAEIERLKGIVEDRLNENDEFGAEFVITQILKDKIAEKVAEIETLNKAVADWRNIAGHNVGKFQATEAKLAAALDALECMASDEFSHIHIYHDEFGDERRTNYIGSMWYARETLAKIKGEKHE